MFEFVHRRKHLTRLCKERPEQRNVVAGGGFIQTDANVVLVVGSQVRPFCDGTVGD